MNILMIIFVVVVCFISDLLKNILKRNCSLFFLYDNIYLPDAMLCSDALYPFIHA